MVLPLPLMVVLTRKSMSPLALLFSPASGRVSDGLKLSVIWWLPLVGRRFASVVAARNEHNEKDVAQIPSPGLASKPSPLVVTVKLSGSKSASIAPRSQEPPT